ncbi:hypothetical protein V6C27_06010 [Peptococcaceae bacterium 1198_IL3148]
MKQKLIEKKKYTFEDLNSLINNSGTILLQDLLETDLKDCLSTIFVNHTLVVRDVVDISFITYQDKADYPFIHGIVDVYDRVLRENLYNSKEDTSPKFIANDHLADIAIRSNLVINVLELNVLNFIQQDNGNTLALKNKYLIELYTDWHTQMHHKDNEFFRLFF